MRIVCVDAVPASIPYDRREVSAQVARDGVTDVVVKVTADNGLVGWGESCSGADAESVRASIEAMTPFVLGRDPWQIEQMRADLWLHGLWQFRPMTASFAWAGVDMALWDLLGKAADLPVHRLLGGAMRDSVTYFSYLSRGTRDDIAAQCAAGLAAGYDVFYLKVGLAPDQDLAMVAAAREGLGPSPRLRLDANAAWTVAQAVKCLAVLGEYDIDFIEQPVKEHPLAAMAEVRARSVVPVAANEGLWTVSDTIDRIVGRTADVYCFSPYWVGSISEFQRLSWLVHRYGALVCKHTHGEFGIAAAAAQQVLLTLPSIVDGHQQTASHMRADVLAEPIPIATSPRWDIDLRPGLGIEVDLDRLADAAARYRSEGQLVPYQLTDLRHRWGVE